MAAQTERKYDNPFWNRTIPVGWVELHDEIGHPFGRWMTVVHHPDGTVIQYNNHRKLETALRRGREKAQRFGVPFRHGDE